MKISFNKLSSKENYVLSNLNVIIQNDKGFYQSFSSNKNYKDTNNFLNGLSKNAVFKEYMISNFSYKGTCHWKYFYGCVWPYFFFCIESIKILNSLPKEKLNKKIIYEHNAEDLYSCLFLDILKDFCSKNDLEILNIDIKNNILLFLKKIRSYLGFVYRFMVFAILWSIWKLCKNKEVISNVKKNIFLISHASNLEEKKGFIIDRRMDYLYKNLEDKYNPIIFFVAENDLPALVKKNLFSTFYYKNYFFYLNVFDQFKFYFQKNKNIFKTPKKILNLKIVYNKINLEECINHINEHINKNIFKKTICISDSCKKLFDHFDPKLTLLTYETGIFQRAAIKESSQRDIPSFGLQHGMIFSNHYDYTPLPITQQNDPWAFNIPNIMFVWGMFWKNVLLKFNTYLDDNIVISGNLQDVETPKILKSQFRTSKNILLLTNCIQTLEFLTKVKGVLSTFKNINLVHRPHPSEVDHTDLWKTLDIKQSKGTLGESFDKADIIISPLSTIIIDALRYRKPAILFHHTKEKGWEDFKSIKGFFYTENESDLKTQLSYLMNLSSKEHFNLQQEMIVSSENFNAVQSENIIFDYIHKVLSS